MCVICKVVVESSPIMSLDLFLPFALQVGFLGKRESLKFLFLIKKKKNELSLGIRFLDIRSYQMKSRPYHL